MIEAEAQRSGSSRHPRPNEKARAKLGESAADEVAARSQLRRQMRRRQQARRAAIAGAIMLVAVLLVWLIFGSAVFAVKSVDVEGQQILMAEQVSEQAAVPIGKPLARIKVNGIAERVEQLPAVGEAEVRRGWPNTLLIKVQERTPKFQIKDGAGFNWIDEQGVVFHVTGDAQPVPLVSADLADQNLLRGIAEMINALPADVQSQIAGIDATRINRITINLSDERQIIWGNVKAPAEKGTVLAVLLKQPGKIYDVSVPSHPAIS